MKKTIYQIIGRAVAASFLGAAAFTANAQKLPHVQAVSVRAPENIKIDGKTTEWGDKFQAYNNPSRIFYTVSNDDNNLYLTARMDGLSGSDKAILGGITFTVRGPQASKLKDIAVTYTILSDVRKTDVIRDNARAYAGLSNDTVANRKIIDTLVTATNKRIDNLFKEIKVAGIKEIAQPLISIYNTEGIKVSAKFNNRMEYTYELAIPLKYLGTAINSGEKFRYNIKLNGMPMRASNGAPSVQFPSTSSIGSSPEYLYSNTPSGFGGEYTLAKK